MQAYLPLPKVVAESCESVEIHFWGVICSLLGLDMRIKGVDLTAILDWAELA